MTRKPKSLRGLNRPCTKGSDKEAKVLERFGPAMYSKHEENRLTGHGIGTSVAQDVQSVQNVQTGENGRIQESKVESNEELEVKQGHKPGNNRSSRRPANIQKMEYQRCNNFQLFAKCEHPENVVPKMQHSPALCPGTAQQPRSCSISLTFRTPQTVCDKKKGRVTGRTARQRQGVDERCAQRNGEPS